MDTETIITLVIAIIGSGGISAIIATILSASKYKAEAAKLRQEIETAKTDDKLKIDQYIKDQLIQLNENHKKEADDLRAKNEALSNQVSDLTHQIHQLMSWVVCDNQKYRDWLETELLKVNPDIQFPDYGRPPKFVQAYMDNELQISNT